MNDNSTADTNPSTPQRTIDGLNNACSIKLIKSKLATLDRLYTDLSTICKTIKELSTELQELTDAEENSPTHRYIGEESHHLVYEAKNLDSAQDKYKAALQFVNDCVSLRCNDSQMTKVCHHGLFPPVEYGSVISDCLHLNSHVAIITLHLETMFNHNNDYDAGMIQQSIKHLLRYIGSSNALRQLNMYCSDNTYEASTRDMTLAALLLAAIGKNGCIDEVHWLTYIPPLAFFNVMSTTTSVKTLIIECAHFWHSYSHSQKSMILESITRNQSVENLTIQTREPDDWTVAESVLRQLTLGPPDPPLEYLSLVGNGCTFDELRHLEHYLESTTTLYHLELNFFDLLGGHMDILIRGLELHYAGPTSCLAILQFTECSFDNEAAAAFVQFIQTPIPNGTSGSHLLEELYMDVTGEDGERVTEFGGVPMGSAMVSLVTTIATRPDHPSIQGTPGRHNTIGSQLQHLSIYPLTSMEGFCDEIKSQARNIELPRLQIAPCGRKECSEMAKWLPYFLSLKDLLISAVDHDVDPNSIIAILQQSRSLYDVTISPADDSGPPYLTDSHTRRIDAICRRNIVLFRLLSRRTHVQWSCTNTILCDHSTRKKRKVVRASEMYATETLLFPSLIQAAKHMPYTRASTIVAALLVFEMEFS